MDGRMEPAEQEALQERLQADPVARRTLDALREEAKLLREALENLSEPDSKLADKVLSVLYAEHRQRTALVRARRFRNQLVAALSAAALVLFALYAIKPEGGAGRM